LKLYQKEFKEKMEKS